MSDIEIRPTGDNALLNETISDRKISWLERAGPENYRIVKGLVRTPLRSSV